MFYVPNPCVEELESTKNILFVFLYDSLVMVVEGTETRGWILIYLSTAIGLTPGGSGTVDIYTKTIHRTTQLPTKQYE
jgi:hypothetical protein